MNKRQIIRLGGAALTGACLLVAACDLSVTNPGPLADEALNVPEAMPALVVGMSADLSVAVGIMIRATSLMSGETAHSGNYANENWWYAGDFDETHVNDLWADMQRARWEAESGIERMKTVLGSSFETDSLSATAYLLAGFANRMLGENVCNAVFDGGPSQPYTDHFTRAQSEFSEAIRLATAQNKTALLNAALAGRASVLAWQGDWAGAVADASQVPTSFVYNAIFSTNTNREQNDFAYETISRREYTVYNTEWANVVGDPRLPWDTVKTSSGKFQTGQDGVTRFYRQKKYTSLGSNVPLVKGTEMLVLRAEAALRNSDLTGMTTLINQERAAYGLAPIAEPATVDDAWPVLQFERGAVTWLETRRFWDERRWGAEGLNTFLVGRASCIPISMNEQMSNPNLH
jgi:hypothetical protein